MKVTLNSFSCGVEREANDKPIYTESAFYYAVKQELNRQGHDVIKKLMHKDGHLFGDGTLYYLRSRAPRTDPEVMIYDNNWAVKDLVKEYRENGSVGLAVQRRGRNHE